MMTENSPQGQIQEIAAEDDGPLLEIILYSNSDNAHHRFCVPERMRVGAFLEHALDYLAKGHGAERVAALRRYYEPVLELQGRTGNRELPAKQSLLEAGVGNGSVCQIAARPLKERIMFCSYS